MNPENENFLPVVVVSGVIILLAVFIVLFVFFLQGRKQKHLLEKQNMQSRFQQELLRTQLEIQEQTLKTISEEIHDNVGQVLSLAKLNLGTLDNPEDPKIKDTKTLVSKAISDLRNLSRSMHSDVIAELGLKQSIENELLIIENTRQFSTSLKVNGITQRFDKQKEMVLFRIAQEALNNCIKYSKAKTITVELNYSPHSFLLCVTDDGIGFNETATAGIGLKSMQNRARLIGAEFSVNSSPGNGTKVCVELLTP